MGTWKVKGQLSDIDKDFLIPLILKNLSIKEILEEIKENKRRMSLQLL